MKFSEKVKSLRISAGLTQQQLSKHLGITASAIGYLENGQRDPTGSTLISYARYFNTTIDSLVGLEPDLEDGLFNTTEYLQQNKNVELSPDEQELLEDYRSLTPALREMLKATIRTWKGTSANTSSSNKSRRT